MNPTYQSVDLDCDLNLSPATEMMHDARLIYIDSLYELYTIT